MIPHALTREADAQPLHSPDQPLEGLVIKPSEHKASARDKFAGPLDRARIFFKNLSANSVSPSRQTAAACTTVDDSTPTCLLETRRNEWVNFFSSLFSI